MQPGGAAAAEKDAVVQAAEPMDLESGRGDEGEQFEDPPRDITGIAIAFEESQVLEPPVVGTVVRIAEVTLIERFDIEPSSDFSAK